MQTNTGMGHLWLVEGRWGGMWRAKHGEHSSKCRTPSLKSSHRRGKPLLSQRWLIKSRWAPEPTAPRRSLMGAPGWGLREEPRSHLLRRVVGLSRGPELGWSLTHQTDRPDFPCSYGCMSLSPCVGPLVGLQVLARVLLHVSQESCSLVTPLARQKHLCSALKRGANDRDHRP